MLLALDTLQIKNTKALCFAKRCEGSDKAELFDEPAASLVDVAVSDTKKCFFRLFIKVTG